MCRLETTWPAAARPQRQARERTDGTFGYTAYNASKYAVVGFSEALRFELAPQRVSVHVVCPPEFDSPMVAELNRSRTPENRAHIQLLPSHDIDTIARETLSGIARATGDRMDQRRLE